MKIGDSRVAFATKKTSFQNIQLKTFASINKAGGDVSEDIICTGEENIHEVTKVQRDHNMVETKDDTKDKMPSSPPSPVIHLQTPCILSNMDNSWTPSNTTPITFVFRDCERTFGKIELLSNG